MKLLTIPGVHFTQVTYLDDQTLLTAGAETTAPVWIWEPGGHPSPKRIADIRASVAWGLFTPGADRFLRRQGLWPDGAELPPPPQCDDEASPALLPESLRTAFPVAFAADAATALYAEVLAEEGGSNVQFHLRESSGLVRPVLRTTLSYPLGAAFSPDGRLVAMAGGPRSVAVQDVPPVSLLMFLPHGGKVEGFAFTADNQVVVAAGRTVWIWDVPGARRAQRLTVEKAVVKALAVSPDGKLLAVGGRDGVVRVWDVSTWAERARHDWGIGGVNRLAFSPDGSTAAAAGAKGVAVWDID
jgi:WD40 repeat protein